MADNVAVTAGSGTTVAADEVIDGTLGTVKVQYVKIMDGTLDGTGKAAVGTNNLSVSSVVSNTAGSAQAQVVANSDALGNQVGLSVNGQLQNYNGTTWDRVRGDTTNGLWANVKASALPTGAATAAKQPALGTAGTPSTDVITVQGATSMTALKVDGSAVTQPVSASALPLPTGASTSANQTTANTSLSTIAT